jgi:hypothetical protein
MAGLFLDKGKLNTDIGTYSGAIQNYKDAIQLNPSTESLVSAKMKKLANLFMKDAYLAAKDDEFYLVVNSLKSIIELAPELTNELEPYLIKLETPLKNQHSSEKTNYAQDYIKKRKMKTVIDNSQVLQLGMTQKEVKKIMGIPKYTDNMNEPHRQFEMWTYTTDSTISRLYFENNMLMRIEK